MDDRLEVSRALTKRAEGRISSEGLEQTNINSYIASLTDAAGLPGANEVNPDHRRGMERQVGMYSYLRDQTGAQTVGDAWKSLEGRKVDAPVVKLWVEEEMAVNPGIFNAVAKGYPELRTRLNAVRKQVVDRHLGKGSK